MVRASVTKAVAGLDAGAKAARDEMMATLIQLSKEEIKGRRQPGEKATAGQPPMNRTGNLRRSITGEKYSTGFATHYAIVGPTMIYGRAVEIGGIYAPPSWQNTSAMRGFPYMQPAFKKFSTLAPGIISKHLGLGNA